MSQLALRQVKNSRVGFVFHGSRSRTCRCRLPCDAKTKKGAAFSKHDRGEKKIQEKIAKNESFWAEYFVLPITEEAKEEPVIRKNDERDIENLQKKEESYNDIRDHAHAN